MNYHFIFSDELSPDLIEQHFLNALPTSYTLKPQYDHFRRTGEWRALPNAASRFTSVNDHHFDHY